MSATSLAKPHFFQPLIPGFEDKFLIPVSFFKYLNVQECHKVTLRSQGGNLWPIKVNGRQFSDGWRQFVQDHDLHIGDFLLFRHEGDLVFDVVVFDRSTCEREYPPFIHIKEEDIEIPQHVPVYTSRGKKVGRKKTVNTRLEENTSSSDLDQPYPHCVVNITNDIINKSRLYIPLKFGRKNGLWGRFCSVILKDEDKNCWRAKLVSRAIGSCNIYVIGAGWRDFQSVHKFKAGDLLKLELIKNGATPLIKLCKIQEHWDFTWEPMCQNSAEVGSSSPEHLHADTEAFELRRSQQKIPEVAKESGSEPTYQHKTQAVSSSPGHLHVHTEASEIRTNEPKVSDAAKESGSGSKVQEPREFTWEPMNQNSAQVGSSSPGHFHAGTKTFELRKSQPKIPEVARESDSGKSKQYKQTKKVKASSSASKKSFFVAKVKSGTHKTSQLHVPLIFSKVHLHNKNFSSVILRDKEGRSWLAKLRYNFMDEKVYIRYGWKEFSAANKLKPGDLVAFEFIENGKIPVFQMCRFKKFSGNDEEVELPHFYVNMQIAFNRKYRVRIPRDFVKKHDLTPSKCSTVTITNENGKSRAVSLTMDKKGEVYMALGWIKFTKENGIRGEDVFMLELVKGGTAPEMKYYALKQEMDSNQKGTWEDFEDIKPII